MRRGEVLRKSQEANKECTHSGCHSPPCALLSPRPLRPRFQAWNPSRPSSPAEVRDEQQFPPQGEEFEGYTSELQRCFTTIAVYTVYTTVANGGLMGTTVTVVLSVMWKRGEKTASPMVPLPEDHFLTYFNNRSNKKAITREPTERNAATIQGLPVSSAEGANYHSPSLPLFGELSRHKPRVHTQRRARL